jgi:hypothetical protein
MKRVFPRNNFFGGKGTVFFSDIKRTHRNFVIYPPQGLSGAAEYTTQPFRKQFLDDKFH